MLAPSAPKGGAAPKATRQENRVIAGVMHRLESR
jgi:hypothetical protein